jgi:hypothetical protein
MKLELQPVSRLRYSPPLHRSDISMPQCKSPLSFQQLPHSLFAKSFSVRLIRTAMGVGGYHHLRASCTCAFQLGSLGPMPNSLRFCTYRNRAANPCRINTSKTSQVCIKTNGFKPFRIRTYRSTSITNKTKNFKPSRINTYAMGQFNSFRMNTYKKERRGVPRRPTADLIVAQPFVPVFRRSQRRLSLAKDICHPTRLHGCTLTLLYSVALAPFPGPGHPMDIAWRTNAYNL